MNINTSSKGSRKKSSRSTKPPGPPKLSEHPDLEDLFLRRHQSQDRLQLMEEHRERMGALKQMHLAKLQAIREQVQLELFKIWNEMWLQKKAAYSKAHKEFLKVLAS
jgi:hypothetical protein